MVNPFITPILLNVFNRPEETTKVLAVLRDLRPTYLFVHCDGPRDGNENDIVNVSSVRRIIEDGIDWPCDLRRLYEEKNLGCGKGPANAITWFFSNVEEGIILEDDCCPHPDFFPYCQMLLERYRNNSQIGIISGTCFIDNITTNASYRFSAYAGIWGWATWRRTWNLFDFDFTKKDTDFITRVRPFLKSRQATNYWLNILHKCKQDGPDRSYWDYQLHLSLLYENKIHVLPNNNIVTNIGFNEKATHTFDADSIYANRVASGILPLIHPDSISINHRLDNLPYVVSFKKRITRLIKRIAK